MFILEELYHGNINPMQRNVKSGSEYQKLNEELVRYIDAVRDLLDDEQKELCEKIADVILNLNYISEKECFVEGFRIGAKMMWESVYLESENFRSY